MSKHNRIEPEPPVPPQPQAAPAALKPKQTFCTWLDEKKIEATINLVIVGFKIPLNCKTILVVLGLVVIGALILIIPRVPGNTCAYAGIASTDEEAIVWSINAEGEAVVEENMGAIEKIFAPDAVFVDRLTQEKWFSPLERYTHLFAAADTPQLITLTSRPLHASKANGHPLSPAAVERISLMELPVHMQPIQTQITGRWKSSAVVG